MEKSGSAMAFLVLFPVEPPQATLRLEDRIGYGGMSPRASPNAYVWNEAGK